MSRQAKDKSKSQHKMKPKFGIKKTKENVDVTFNQKMKLQEAKDQKSK